jgi:hypothetical protein
MQIQELALHPQDLASDSENPLEGDVKFASQELQPDEIAFCDFVG